MEIRHRKNKPSKISNRAVAVALVVTICCGLAYQTLFGDDSMAIGASHHAIQLGGTEKNGLEIPVFFPIYTDANGESTLASSPVTEKLMQDLQNSASISEAIPLDMEHPPEFLVSCGDKTIDTLQRFAVLKSSRQPHLAGELLKYCALEHYRGGLYLDSQSTLSSTIDHVVTKMTKNSDGNLAILNDPKISPDSIHGALLYIKKKSNSLSVVEGMIHVLMSTDIKILESSPLLLPKQLYGLIAKDMGVEQLTSKSDAKWYLLQHNCNLFSLGQRDLTVPISTYALNSHR